MLVFIGERVKNVLAVPPRNGRSVAFGAIATVCEMAGPIGSSSVSQISESSADPLPSKSNNLSRLGIPGPRKNRRAARSAAFRVDLQSAIEPWPKQLQALGSSSRSLFSVVFAFGP